MTTQIWIPGTIGSWTDGDDWQSGQAPSTGDTAIVGSGAPTVTSGTTIAGEAIVLGGSDTATSVTLTAIDAVFEGSGTGSSEINTTLSVTGGTPGSALEAIFIAQGNTTFDGQILVGAIGGGLTIDASGAGNSFTFDNDDGKAVMVVYQESTLSFSGGTIVNDGILQIEGGLDIGSSTSIAPEEGQTGHIFLENGGTVSNAGSIGERESIDFGDPTGRVTLQNGSHFMGSFGFGAEANGNTIDVEGVAASSLSFVAPTSTEIGELQLLDGSGNVLKHYGMQLIDANFSPLLLADQTLDVDDFTLSSDGNGGSLITYAPDAPQILQQSLAVPIQAAAGTLVSLSSILKQSFGTDSPAFHSITLLPSTAYTNIPTDVGYWSSPNITPTWFVNWLPVTAPTVVTDIDDVWLGVGDQISNPAQFLAQVTDIADGRSAEYVQYNAWTVDPAIVEGVSSKGFGGLPTPGAVIASAETFAATYPLVPNTNFCNWIADNVAAGAGATMPFPNASLDPSQNVPGGFWRIVFTGVGPDPVSNWSTLVKPGDIVRMGWFKPEAGSGVASGHSTTVLGTVNKAGEIRFYDNVDWINHVEYIGIHNDDYWLHSDPADITIYRLDPNSQYLIQGSSLSEMVQGSVYNDLIQPGGGADTITTGPGHDEIQGTTAELDGITVTDLAVGDSLDFANLPLAQASISYSAGALHVASNGVEVATLSVARPKSGRSYVLSDDGNGGSLVQLLGSVTINGSYPAGYAINPDVLNLLIEAGTTVNGPGVSAATTHITNVVNLGTVDALGTGITLLAGGSIVNGSATNTTASISGQNGIEFKGPGTITNYGIIEGATAIVFDGPGTLINYGTLGNIGTLSSAPPKTQYLVTFNNAGARLVLEGSSQLNAIDGSPGKVRGGGGTLELGALAGPGTLNGLGSGVNGFASVTIDKNAVWNFGTGASVVATGTTLDNAGSLSLLATLAARGAIENGAGATIDLAGDVGISSSAAIDNDGVLEKTAGTGVSLVRTTGASFSSHGTIDVQTGTLQLTGAAIDISGAIGGAGTMLFGAGDTTFERGTSLAVGNLAVQGTGAHVTVATTLIYSGNFSAASNAELTIGLSRSLSLASTATFNGATVDGAGRLETNAETTVRQVSVGGTVEWNNAGALLVAGDLTVGATAHFLNRAGGNVTLASKAGLVGAPGGNVVNQGLISKFERGTATVGAVLNRGAIQAAGGVLDLQGAVSGRGDLVINGGVLEADAAVSPRQTVHFVGSPSRLLLTDAPSFGAKLATFGAGDRLDLRQFDPTTTTLAFKENADGTQGKLTVTDGSLSATLTLLGQFAAAGFHAAADGLGGTNITYKEPSASLLATPSH